MNEPSKNDPMEQIQVELRVLEMDQASPPANNTQEPLQPGEQPQTSAFKLINQTLKVNHEHDSLQKY